MKKRLIALLLAGIMVVSDSETTFAAIQSPSNQIMAVDEQNYNTAPIDNVEGIELDSEVEESDGVVQQSGIPVENTDRVKTVEVTDITEDVDGFGIDQDGESSLDFTFKPGYVPAPYEDEYESPYENYDGDKLIALETKYISDAAVNKPSRSQSPHGTCWAFSTISAVEMSAAKRGVKMPNGSSASISTDLSELHLAYFAGRGLNPYDPLGGLDGDLNQKVVENDGTYYYDPYDSGGSVSNAANLLSCWIGAADETDYPYSNEGNYSFETSNRNAMNDVLHLRNYYVANPKTDPAAVKNLIKGYGAVTVSYHAFDDSNPVDGYDDDTGLTENQLYIKTSNCYYVPQSVGTNHAVSIIGWDDNFSRSKFAYSTKPEGDGAWLIRNSWSAGNKVNSSGSLSGSNAEYYSYFWLSYYDKSISDSCYAFDMGTLTEYDHNYQYDGSMISGTYSKYSRYANIFTAGSGSQTLKAVYFATHSANVDYTIDVYTGVTEGNPTSGMHVVDSQSGSTVYAGGHTINLDTPVDLVPGEKFSVIISIPIDKEIDLERSCPKEKGYLTNAHTESGRSMYYSDTADYWFNSIYGDIRIKAFTVDDNSTRYTITYNANGGIFDSGETTQTRSIRSGQTYGAMPEPRRDGYAFAGWYTSSTGGTKVTSSSTVSSSRTLYAHWTAKTYTLTLNANGGKISGNSTQTKQVNYGEAYGNLPTPTREGYSFAGWYSTSSSTGGEEITEQTKHLQESNRTIYARWNSAGITVTLNANGGSCAKTSVTVTYGSTYGNLPTPTKTGYDFAGWYTYISGGTKVTSTTSVTNSKAHTLYAHWTAKTYTITLNANGGKINGNSTQTKQVNYGEAYGTLPTPTREGYSFAGWYSTSSSTGGEEITEQTKHLQESNRTIYARWNSAGITVTLNANGGSCDKTSVTVTYGSTYGTLPTPTKTGYDFAGWYTAASGGTKVTSTSSVTNSKAHTIYAHWTAKTYTLTLNANRGTINGKTTYTKQVNYGKTYGTLPEPIRDGYDFIGWYTTSSSTGGEEITEQTKHLQESNRTIYARWTNSDITVTLDPNGGECNKSSVSVKYASAYGSLPTPTRKGYVFQGWFTAKTGGKKITDTTNVDSTKNHTLYAQWDPVTCTVRFDANGGTCTTANMNVTYDSVYGDLPIPLYEGHQFVGWFLDDQFNTVVNSSTVVKTYTDHTLYAKWIIGKHIVTFDLNGKPGETPIPQEIEDGMMAVRPSDPVSMGYIFTGWYTKSDCSTEFDFDTPIIQDTTLFAGWKEAEKYTITYDPNGAYGEPPFDENRYNTGDRAVIMKQGALTKNGCLFAGWSEDPNGIGAVYFPEDIIEIRGNIVLYALWTEKNELQQWGFSNSQEFFGKAYNGYQVSAEDNNRLLSRLSRVDRVRLERALKNVWNGDCYGMASSVALINKSISNISDYNLGSDVNTLFDVKSADENYYRGGDDSIGRAESVINYYQVQQYLPENQRLISDFEGYGKVKRMNIVSDLAKNASKDNPFIIYMFWKVGDIELGHAVLGTGYRELSSEERFYNDYPYCITIYDPSLPVEIAQNTSAASIYFNEAGDWYNEGFGISPDNEELICATDDFSLIAPIDYGTGNYTHQSEAPNEIMYRGDCQVEWGNNIVVLSGCNVIKNSSDHQMVALPEAINGNYADRYRIYVPTSDSYRISSETLDHEFITNDKLISVKSSSGGTAKIDLLGGGQITSDVAGSMAFEVIDNYSNGSIPAHITIEANNVTNLSEKVDAGGIVVAADDLSGLTITTDTKSEKFNLTEDQVLIKEENGDLKLYEDKDKDGSFESEVTTGEEEKKEEEEEENRNSTIVVGQKINLRQTCFADVTDTISRYAVSNTSLAGVSKEMLSGKKPGTVTVYAQRMISRNSYENIAECEVTILNKPKLKFTKNMTYVDQTVNGSDFFLTEDIRTYGAAYWESNKPWIVEVTDSENGTLKAKSSGTAKITAYFGEKGKQGTFKISANLAVKIPSYPKAVYSLQTGAKLPIPMKNVTGALDPEWVTSEEGIARVSAQRNSKGAKTGKAIVEGLSYGDTTLTATIDGQNYTCTIRVTAPEINKKAMTLKVGKQGTVSLKKTKIKKTDVVWNSDNPEVATVDANGKITALKSGNATIYTETGGIRNECYVTVP